MSNDVEKEMMKSMTKGEWKKLADDNADTFARAGLIARQVVILAEAYRSFKTGNDGGRLYLPDILSDGKLVEYDSEEVCDLENRGLIRWEMLENGARSIAITRQPLASATLGVKHGPVSAFL